MATIGNDWNQMVMDAAKKEGIKIPEAPAANAATVATVETTQKEDTPPQPITRTIDIGGKPVSFTGDNEKAVLDQVVAAITGASVVTAKPEVKIEPVKPVTELPKEKMFEIGNKLMTGDASALEPLLEAANNKFLEKHGLTIEDVKRASNVAVSAEHGAAWQNATAAFMKKVQAGQVEYPVSPQNTQLMGMMIARMGLPPKPESFEVALSALKADGLLFPAVTATANSSTVEPKHKATSSSAFGAGAQHDTRARVDPKAQTLTADQLKKMAPAEIAAWTRDQFKNGAKPETVVIQ